MFRTTVIEDPKAVRLITLALIDMDSVMVHLLKKDKEAMPIVVHAVTLMAAVLTARLVDLHTVKSAVAITSALMAPVEHAVQIIAAAHTAIVVAVATIIIAVAHTVVVLALQIAAVAIAVILAAAKTITMTLVTMSAALVELVGVIKAIKIAALQTPVVETIHAVITTAKVTHNALIATTIQSIIQDTKEALPAQKEADVLVLDLDAKLGIGFKKGSFELKESFFYFTSSIEAA